MLDERERDETRQEAAARPEEGKGRGDGEKAQKQGKLNDALRRARLNEAERSDVVLDLREAEAARLELLNDRLSDLFEEIPPGTDLLECALIPGSPPRLWIDVLAYVVMGRDKRTYRFVKETRYGPKVILETLNVDEMTQSVTDYVAHRLLERERALASDTAVPVPAAPAAQAPAQAAQPTSAPVVVRRKGLGWFGFLVTLLLGALIGATALFGYGYYLVSLGP